ncbi:MAG: hypothetical protein JXR78_13195 [Victivallales bacterium]|nr:hypothetical protein [Victivallales bacterium]
MFKSEKSLVNLFQRKSKYFLKKILNKDSKYFFTLHEFDSNHGIADIVIGTYCPYFANRANRPYINSNWIVYLNNLSLHQSFTIDEYLNKFNISKTTAYKHIQEFADAGFIKTTTENYKLIKEYKTVVNNAISIEAKLKNWQKALEQARRYQRFSLQSFVLLDNHFVSPSLKNIETFKKYNVGLMSLSTDELLEIHFIPKINKSPQDCHMNFKLNEEAYKYFINNYLEST